METTFTNVTTDNDTKVNANTLSADGCCPYKAGCTIPEQPEVVGFFPLSGRSYPKLTPTDKITAVPPDRKYAEIFSEGIAVVEMRKSSALKICSILDRSGLHYRAVASKSKARLYFQNRNIQGCYHGATPHGIQADIAGSKGYLKPLKEPVEVLHADDSYSMLPPWLCPVEIYSDEFVKRFIKQNHLVNLDNILHWYDNGMYLPINMLNCEDLLWQYFEHTTFDFIREMEKRIYSQLGLNLLGTISESNICSDPTTRCKPEMIAFNNGIYDISTGKWADFSPEIIITNRIPIDYVDFGEQIGNGAKTKAMEIIDNWLDMFSGYNPEKRAVLEEAAGLTMYQKNEGLRRQHTILVGPDEFGKTIFRVMVQELIGTINFSEVSVEDLCSPDGLSLTHLLIGKILNCSRYLSEVQITDAAPIKNLCTGDATTVEPAFEPAVTWKWNGKMLLEYRNYPRNPDPAITDNFELIPCNTCYSITVTIHDKDRLFTSILQPDCMKYWCYLAVQGLKRYIDNNYSHTYCEEIDLFYKNYIDSADTLISSLMPRLAGHNITD